MGMCINIYKFGSNVGDSYIHPSFRPEHQTVEFHKKYEFEDEYDDFIDNLFESETNYKDFICFGKRQYPLHEFMENNVFHRPVNGDEYVRLNLYHLKTIHENIDDIIQFSKEQDVDVPHHTLMQLCKNFNKHLNVENANLYYHMDWYFENYNGLKMLNNNH